MKINLVTLKNNLGLFILIQVSQVLNLLGYNIYQAMQYNLYTKKAEAHLFGYASVWYWGFKKERLFFIFFLLIDLVVVFDVAYNDAAELAQASTGRN